MLFRTINWSWWQHTYNIMVKIATRSNTTKQSISNKKIDHKKWHQVFVFKIFQDIAYLFGQVIIDDQSMFSIVSEEFSHSTTRVGSQVLQRGSIWSSGTHHNGVLHCICTEYKSITMKIDSSQINLNFISCTHFLSSGQLNLSLPASVNLLTSWATVLLFCPMAT